MASLGYLSEEQHQLVDEAVARAESLSSGEIVTVIADRSDGYSDIALAWAAFVAFSALTLLALFPAFFLDSANRLAGGWNAEWSQRGILSLAAMLAIALFLLTWLAQLWLPLKFLLVPGHVKTERVRQRAITVFRIGAERRTQERTGIVIYLSMREHRAEIVADEAIAMKVAPEIWGDAMAAMIEQVREGRIAEGMAAAVERVGAVLAEHFPRAPDDRNELPDRLIEL